MEYETQLEGFQNNALCEAVLLIIIMYIYYGLFFDALSAYMIHINLNTIFYTHAEHSPTKTVYIKYYMERKKKEKKKKERGNVS